MPNSAAITGLLTVAGPALLGALDGTLKILVINRPVARRYATGREPAIGVFFHRRLVVFGALYRRLPVAVMISRSRDGDIAAAVLRRTRLRAIRGSSSRGGREALAELIETLRGGGSAAFACDGPRGPAGVVKIGCVVAAQRTGLPLLPMSWVASREIRLRSWDRMCIPVPGSRVAVAFGEPVFLSSGLSESECEARRAALQSELDRLEAAARLEVSPRTG